MRGGKKQSLTEANVEQVPESPLLLGRGDSGKGEELTHTSVPQKRLLWNSFFFLATCIEERGAFQGPPKSCGALLTMCLVFREQRDRALGHRRKGSKAKRLLQVMFIFLKKKKDHSLHDSVFHDAFTFFRQVYPLASDIRMFSV